MALRTSECGQLCHWNSRLTLLRATMKGVLRCLSRLIDSIVCGSSPCIMSTTRIAMSHSEEPRLRRLLKDSWPGVSIINIPGILSSCFANSLHIFVCSRIASYGTFVAPICWVMPPASPSCTFVRRSCNRSFVLPVSTCPSTTTTGALRTSVDLFFSASSWRWWIFASARCLAFDSSSSLSSELLSVSSSSSSELLSSSSPASSFVGAVSVGATLAVSFTGESAVER
ncbi:hypothetical protein NP493_19g02018 [Ridgeia piscesae]|uniref:Uncharacterized protein n=1 Tax=Ridgeia piscesae TaxID=27915 RepID=A0AAD9UKK2_RIDPI|nr:hypothetical protein NP493_19g02018 [Ridgeia piscesae]